MSGAEIVGFVLGAIPLAISALEHYKEGIDVIQDYRNYRSILKSLKTKLTIQEELYRGTLQRLLLSELSPYEVLALFPEAETDGDSVLWGTPDIDAKLRRKLGVKYGVFMDVVVDMNQIMQQLMEKLDIDMKGKPQWAPENSTRGRFQDRFDWEWSRIRRSFNKGERESLIRSFEAYNNDLASFVQNREILSPQSDGRATQIVKYLDLMRIQACGLHNVLKNSWKCSCNTPHKAYLRLQHPTEVSPSSPVFGVTFPYHRTTTAKSQESDLTWKHTFVCVSKADDQAGSSEVMTSSSATSLTSTNMSLSVTTINSQTSQISIDSSSSLEVKTTRKSRKVQFSKVFKMTSREISSTPAPSIVLQPSPAAQPLNNSSPQIALSRTLSSTSMTLTCLCKALSVEASTGECLGHFVDAKEDHTASITAEQSVVSSDDLCLETLLSKNTSSPHSPNRMSDTNRLRVALILASTVLQLYDSPWLDSLWNRKQIHFLTPGPPINQEPAINEPLVVASFNEQSCPPDVQDATSSLVNCLIPSRPLFALAVILIELCLNKTLLELRQAAPNQDAAQESTVLDDYETANEQLNAVYQKSGSNYGDVVQRCLKCEFNITPKQKRLDFEKFRHLVYEGVVAPLEDNYKKYLLYRGDM